MLFIYSDVHEEEESSSEMKKRRKSARGERKEQQKKKKETTVDGCVVMAKDSKIQERNEGELKKSFVITLK